MCVWGGGLLLLLALAGRSVQCSAVRAAVCAVWEPIVYEKGEGVLGGREKELSVRAPRRGRSPGVFWREWCVAIEKRSACAAEGEREGRLGRKQPRGGKESLQASPAAASVARRARRHKKGARSAAAIVASSSSSGAPPASARQMKRQQII